MGLSKSEAKVIFGIELFGEERFVDPNKRFRTWGLKGSTSGSSNRFSIFQKHWLRADAEYQDEASIQKGNIELIDAQLREISQIRKWIDERRKSISRCLETKNAGGANRSACKATILSLKDQTERLLGMLSKRPSDVGLSKGHAKMLKGMCKWLRDLLIKIGGINGPDKSTKELREGLLSLRSDLKAQHSALSNLSKEIRDKERAPFVKELRRLESQYPQKATAACVSAMLQTDEQGIAKSELCQAFERDKYGFATSFCIDVIPAIEEGFRAERYPSERIGNFQRQMDDLANDLTRPDETGDKEALRKFLTVLVSALIYGPESAGMGAETSWESVFDLEYDEPNGIQILLAQRFASDGRYLGEVRLFNTDDLIFLGRCDDIDDYESKCKSLVEESKGVLGDKKKQLFNVSEEHTQVSNLHGAIFYDDGVWRYRDFSRFGTRVVGKGKGASASKTESHCHNGFCELEPGDVLYLGAKSIDTDERRLHRKAAAIGLAYHLDEDAVTLNTL